jgi:hypothetical protein
MALEPAPYSSASTYRLLTRQELVTKVTGAGNRGIQGRTSNIYESYRLPKKRVYVAREKKKKFRQAFSIRLYICPNISFFARLQGVPCFPVTGNFR